MVKQFTKKAIILCAGEGSRLRPYTLDCPKCLVPLNGVPLLERQLAVLRSQNVEDITLVGGYLADSLNYSDMKLVLNDRYAETNMVWSLFCARHEMNDETVISYGDIVYSPNILRKILDSTADIAVAIDLDWEEYWRARSEDFLSDAESLIVHDSNKIIEIGKKPKSLDDIQGQYMGLMKLSTAGLEQLKTIFDDIMVSGQIAGKSLENAYMTDLLQEMIDRGISVQAVKTSDYWIEVDTVSDLELDVTLARASKIIDQLKLCV